MILFPSTRRFSSQPSRPVPSVGAADDAMRRRPGPALLAVALAMLGVAGCAQAPQPQQIAAGHGKEYFPASIYGAASRRVIADGQPIPHGGGQYLVGKPYTVAGQTYYPSERAVRQVGLASWYGDAFHGRLTANGEIYDRDGFTAAHPTMPLPSYARVTNLRNNYTMVVRVNDRGPYHAGRIMDVSRRVAEALDFQGGGTAKVKVEYVGRASLAGSDDAKLYATLRRDGVPGPEERSLLAEAATLQPASARVASLSPFAAEDRRIDGERARGDGREAGRMRDERRREHSDARGDRDDDRRAVTRADRTGEGLAREQARDQRAEVASRLPPPRRRAGGGTDEERVATRTRGEGGDRRRMAALAVGLQREPAESAGRRTDRADGHRREERTDGGRRRGGAAEIALPPPRPQARASSRGGEGGGASETAPSRRMHLALAETARKSGGMRLTHRRED